MVTLSFILSSLCCKAMLNSSLNLSDGKDEEEAFEQEALKTGCPNNHEMGEGGDDVEGERGEVGGKRGERNEVEGKRGEVEGKRNEVEGKRGEVL